MPLRSPAGHLLAALALSVAALGSLLPASPATTYACTLDGKPTASADGVRAVYSHLALTGTTARWWAPFTFPDRYRAHTWIRFAEDRSALGQVLPLDSLQRPWRWEFGDGERAIGWQVAHRYVRPGSYRLAVDAYDTTWRQYYPFDSVRIVITRA